MIKNYNFIASDKEILRVTTFYKEAENHEKVIILVHGFKGFKDWGFGPYLCDSFSNKGYYVLSFNFSHNGIGENLTEFTELEKFSRNTFSREVRELNELIVAIRSGVFEGVETDCRIGLIGHSRGGAISILSSSNRKDIRAIALWSSIAKLDRYTQRQKEEWRKKGSFDVMNMRTKQVMSLKTDLLDDLEKNSNDSLNIENAVKNLTIPLLIAHGDQDLAVPIKEAELLYEWSDKTKTEFYKIFGTGHTFDIVHPFAGTNDKFEKLIEKTNMFFLNNL